ncbi:MAG: sugar phosphate isomerase/epimerase [Planctomycetes bacterium]|nr:sugar phosphate isomerase/epimerase [Planctomycetota bacterium]
MHASQIALQLYTLRDRCATAADLATTIARVRKIGYTAVQISGVGPIPETEIVRICRGEGVAICATHEPGKTIVEEPQKVIDRLGALGCRHTAYPHPHIKPTTLDEALAIAAQLDRAGEALRKAGMVLTYHNHALEFRKFGGRTWLDILYSETDPRNLQGEIDTYWVQTGGGDPVAWCRRLYRRLPLLHLKDYGIDDQNKPTMMEIGNGVLDWPAIISAADDAGTEWFIVEQDICPADPFDSITQSLRFLAQLASERRGTPAAAPVPTR